VTEATHSAEPRARRAWPWFLSIGVAVALVVGLVWAAGGFAYRDDLATTIQPGERFTNGPYEFTFSTATIQKTKDYKDQQIWSVVVIGTGRTTGDTSISPDRDLFVVKDAGSGSYQEKTERQEFGAERTGGNGSLFTPGLPAIPYRLVYQFPVSAFEPGSTVIFVSWQLEWRDTSLLQVGDYRWASTHDYFRLDLPLKRLPDDLD
jgi:hypothetical protein